MVNKSETMLATGLRLLTMLRSFDRSIGFSAPSLGSVIRRWNDVRKPQARTENALFQYVTIPQGALVHPVLKFRNRYDSNR